jgi:dTDP-4-dehydrorhamnose 3,5-epimerase-like enzyme
MDIQPLKLAGTYEIVLKPRQDERGYFMRVLDLAIFAEFGLQTMNRVASTSIPFVGCISSYHPILKPNSSGWFPGKSWMFSLT